MKLVEEDFSGLESAGGNCIPAEYVAKIHEDR